MAHAVAEHRDEADRQAGTRFAESKENRVERGAVSAGVFSLRDRAYINSMPVHNASGFWQAWRMPDGLFMIQPLDHDHVPWGTMYLLEPQEFSHLLSPLEHHSESVGPVQVAGRVAGPDFLAIWYEQALAEQEAVEHGGHSAAAGAPAWEEVQAAWLSATPAKAPVSSDETVLMPFWHPDEFFADEGAARHESRTVNPDRAAPGTGSGWPGTGSARVARAAGSNPLQNPAPAAPAAYVKADDPDPDDDLFSDIMTPEALSGPRPLDFLPPLSLEDKPGPERNSAGSPADVSPKTAAPATPRPYGPGVTVETVERGRPAGGATEFRDDDGYAEERAARLERSMRNEFSSLMTLLEKGSTPELERAFSRLLQRGTGFSSQQKFMFSEFGLALRRKHRHKLAMACHLRALELAPFDEYVLFNVARSKFELRDVESARNYLARALAIAPDFATARKFLSFLEDSSKTE